MAPSHEPSKRLLEAEHITRRQLEALVGLINFACQVHCQLRIHLQPLTRGSLVHATTKGMWSPTDKEVHINTLELRAVRLAIQFFQLSRCHLVVYTYNETVRYTLKQLRTKSTTLREELKSLLNYTVGRRIIMHPLRIPTELNVVADGLSCLEPANTEWTLPKNAFQAILRWAGPPQVDIMASAANHQLPLWVSPFPHPYAIACDCLGIDWNAFDNIYVLSTNQHDTRTNPPHPQLSGTVGADCPMGPNHTLTTTPTATDERTPTPAHSTIPDLRCRPCLPQVRDLRQMDCISFLRRALLASRPPQIVTTLLPKYMQSQQAAWKAFQRWLPSSNTTNYQEWCAMLPPIVIFRKVACPTHHHKLSSGNPMAIGRTLWDRILSPRFLPPCDGIFFTYALP